MSKCSVESLHYFSFTGNCRESPESTADFVHGSNDRGSDLSAVTKRVVEELPDLQRQVLMTEEKNERKGSPQLFKFFKLVTSVHCQCGQVLAVRPSDLKLIFHVMKLMSLSVVEGESRLSAEEMLTTMNYISSVLLQALNSQDSRATSMMISSEPLLNLLHRTITESKSKSLDVIFSAPKKLRYQSLCVVALLVKSCADFKLKPGHIMKFEVEFILGSLMDKDICVKVVCLQFLTTLLDLEFKSQIVGLLPQHSQPRQGEDAGLELSAATIRSLFFLLQNIILQGSDFLSWNCVQCLSSLLRYIRQRSKQLSDHLAQQPWNEFLINSCMDFYGDTCPSSWLFKLIPLFPTLVSHKKLESLITTAMKQNTATVDHRMLASLLFLLHGKWDQLNSNQKFVDTTKQWLEGLSATITTVASTEITPVEMLYPLISCKIISSITNKIKMISKTHRWC
ncbi:putative meiosis inhibitor protein 1 [Apostichopus japonicus]|uniref:Putative meiosis inhibitor protein 1 n=1 Tax=Stichopus japonicus TaxID=307972 RepID=A0A2G8JWF0_STIJA|nr:putative meiosis inhibitor protein 1 [Apostichopus japonicus]